MACRLLHLQLDQLRSSATAPGSCRRQDRTALDRVHNLRLGLFDRQRRFSRHQRRLDGRARLILHSDGVTARRTEDGLFGLDGIERAVHRAPGSSAAALAKSIQKEVMSASVDKLQDDAVAVVLGPTLESADSGSGSR